MMYYSKQQMKLALLSLLCFIVLFLSQSCTSSRKSASAYYSLDDYKSVPKIDAHVHIGTEDTTYIKLLREDNFRLLTVNVEGSTLDKQQAIAVKQIHNFPDHIAFASSFSIRNWNDPDWQEQTIAYLKDSFAKGAIAVKVWKNIGMELKDKDGKFVMIDNPRFDPIFDFLAKNNIPLLSHQGEPKNCWLPIEEMTVETAKRYFTNNPQYHMYLHPEYPSYEDQINARDRMVEKHPDLKVISVHLASLEWSVDELAKRLDKFPNMAVDMASRIMYLEHQAITDWQKVRDFMIKYQDRILYATDRGTSGLDEKTLQDEIKAMRDVWLQDWQFLTSDDLMTNRNVKGEFKGLKLTREVIDKIYRENAKKWIPGLEKRK